MERAGAGRGARTGFSIAIHSLKKLGSSRSTTIAAAGCLRLALWASLALPAIVQGAGAAPTFMVNEYRVTGSTKLTELEKGETVYPFLGPGRTAEDIEAARQALEKIYKVKGYETVRVEAPVPSPRGGVVHLRVVEIPVGRVRVEGAKYSLPSQIVKHLPSLAPGEVPNFATIERELLALNQWPDRRVSPSLKPGRLPDTVDFDLQVEDKFPLHASLELNNRYSTGTTQLRLNGSFTYNNLWQRGHSIEGSFQISPEDLTEVKVFSGSYTARFPQWPNFSLVLQGTKQDSDVSTLGGAATVGRGSIIGLRGIYQLPSARGFYHSLSAGLDYKDFTQDLEILGIPFSYPLVYYPFTAGYSAGWVHGKESSTELNLGVTFSIRETADELEFDNNRFNARGSFIYLRGDLAHTQELPGGAQLYGKVQGQASSQPLVNSEQFAGGGLGTVRGYREAEALGDDGFFGTVELRSPSLLGWTKARETEWRIHGFFDGGVVTLHDPLPEQQWRFELASMGVGMRLQLFDHFHSSLDVALPLTSLPGTQKGDLMFTFRVWAEF